VAFVVSAKVRFINALNNNNNNALTKSDKTAYSKLVIKQQI